MIMLKQVVCEVVVDDRVEISIGYDFDADLIGKKEFEEVTIGNVTKYWVSVPERINSPVAREYVNAAAARWKEKKAKKFFLIAQKKLRMLRYQEMIENGEEIIPTGEDINDALALAKMEGRKPNLKKLLSAIQN